MKILVFTEGTILVHSSSRGKTREQIVKQVANLGSRWDTLLFFLKLKTDDIHNYPGYIPVGDAVNKIRRWKKQGATIYYLTSRRVNGEVGVISKVLQKYDFPDCNNLLSRQPGEEYNDVAEKLMPDIFIEDDCESIGGAEEMTSTHFNPEAKVRTKTIVIKEFQGIDHLPDHLDQLKEF